MATVKSYELAAYMTMVHKAISDKTKTLFTETATSNPAPQLISGYTPMKGKVDQTEVVALAVLLADLFSKKERGEQLNAAETFIYSSSGKTLSDAIDAVRGALQSKVTYDESMKATLDYLENTSAVNAATKALTTSMKADLQAPNHWAVAVLDVLLVTGLQSVPFVGAILSTVVKGGIVSGVTSALGGMAANQTQALRSTDANLAAAQKATGGQNPLNVMGGGDNGYSFGQRTSGTYKGNEIKNDLGAQAAQNLANQASSQMQNLVNTSAYDKDAAKTNIASQWYSTGLNATFFYTMVKQSKQNSEKSDLKIIANDVEFLKEFAGRDTNRWLTMSQNPQTANQLVALFSNRGASNSKVEQAARLVGAEFEKTLSQDNKTLENFSNSVAKKLQQFRKLVEAFLSMSVSLALVDSIDKFKIKASGSNLDQRKFGTLQKTSNLSDKDENICALLIISYYFINDIKHKISLKNSIKAMDGGALFTDVIDGQMHAVVQRRDEYHKAASLVVMQEKSKQVQANIESTRAQLSQMGDTGRARFIMNAQQATLNSIRTALNDEGAAAKSAQTTFSTLQAARLKTFQVQNDSSAAVNNVKMAGLGSATSFSWDSVVTASNNYVEQLKRATMQDIQAVFPSPAESGFEEALKAVLACTVIISQVHAQSARGKAIEISTGAVSALADPKLDFVRLYTKFLGKATDNDKLKALVQVSGTEEKYRLRWPKDRVFSGSASVAETATMYTFAATVVAYVDLAEIARGAITWKVYKKFLNQVIHEINEKAIDLKNDDRTAYKVEIQRAEKMFEDNQKALKDKLSKEKASEKLAAEKLKKDDKANTKAAQSQLVRNRKF